MSTQTETAEREHAGHYEIDTGGGWERISKRDIRIITHGFDLWRWYRDEPTGLDELVDEYPYDYRYVED